jgi:hypothetical protein
MERQARAVTDAVSGGLLRRQLASIADTLDKARMAGEEESGGRVAKASGAGATPVAQVPYSEFSVTSGFELDCGSDDSEDHVRVEQASGGVRNVASNVHSTTTMPGELSYSVTASGIIANSSPGVEKTKVSLCIGYDSNSPNSDDWKDGGDYTDPKKMLAELDRASELFEKHTKEEADEDDPKRMLAEIEGATIRATQATTPNRGHVTVLKPMLEDLSANQQSFNTIHARHTGEELSLQEPFEKLIALATDKSEVDEDINNKSGCLEQAIIETEKVSSQTTQVLTTEDPKAMLADLDASAKAHGQRLSVDDDSGLRSNNGIEEILETLRSQRITTLRPIGWWTSEGFHGHDKRTRIVDMEEDVGWEEEWISYAVALRLESAGCNWEDVQGWFTYLFSTGMNSYDAQVQKEEMIKRENEKLDAIIEYVLEEEKRYIEIEDKERLPCRLIVSNLAADTDKEAVRVFFSEYKWDL